MKERINELEQLSKQARATRRFVRQYRAAMANITTGWCSDLETRRIQTAGMNDGKPYSKLKPTQTHNKLKRAS